MPRQKTPEHKHYMSQAIALAQRGVGRTSPNPPVGAVLVKASKIVGKGWHRKAGGDHAEVAAIKDAGRKSRGATLYVTLEPCSTKGKTGPCTEALTTAGIAEVIVGSVDPNPRHRGAGLKILKSRGILVKSGIMKPECDDLIAPFAKWMTKRLPYVTLKMAMSLDGRTTDRNGKSQWISCQTSRDTVKRFRGKVDAVMVGARTVIDDDPSLCPLAARGYQPYRVAVSTRGVLPETSKLFKDDSRDRTLVLVGESCSNARERALSGCGAKVLRANEKCGRVSLRSALRRLADEGILHVLCEGGAELAGSLLRERLVDTLQVYSAPLVLGDKGASVLAGVNWSLAKAPRMRIVDVRRIDSDLYTEYRIEE